MELQFSQEGTGSIGGRLTQVDRGGSDPDWGTLTIETVTRSGSRLGPATPFYDADTVVVIDGAPSEQSVESLIGSEPPVTVEYERRTPDSLSRIAATKVEVVSGPQ